MRTKSPDNNGDEVTGERVFLAAFGKHPGWDDHIEDLGLETDCLVNIRRLVYLQGVAGNIDSGAWESLEESQRLSGYKHVFVWRDAIGSLVVGRMWSSSDGKGRSRYPMVICAQCTGLSLAWALGQVLPVLASVEDRCVAAKTADDVRAVIDDARCELRESARTQVAPENELHACRGSLSCLADCPGMGPDQEGLLRILYQIERDMSFYAPERTDLSGSALTSRSHTMRVPACGDSLEEVCRTWTNFLLGQLGTAAPLFLLLRQGETWIDIIAGEPTTQDFFCLCASPEALPLTTEIPYSVDDLFKSDARRRIEASRQGREESILTGAELKAAPATPVRERFVPPVKVSSLVERVRKTPAIWVTALVVGALIVLGVILRLVLRSVEGEQSRRPTHVQEGIGQSADFDMDVWKALCDEYYQWFGRFRRDLTARRVARFKTDPHLAALVADMEEAREKGVELDPRKIAGRKDESFLILAASPTPQAKSEEGVRHTKEALAFIKRVESDLSPSRWPALREIATLEKTWAERGWKTQAQTLKGLVASVTSGTGLAGAADRVLAVAPDARAIEQDWQSIEASLGKLQGASGQALDRRLTEYLLGRAEGAQDLADLRARLDGDVPKLAEIAAAWQRVQKLGQQIEATDDPLLKGFGKVVGAMVAGLPSPGSEDFLDGVRAGLNEIRGVEDELVAFLTGPWQTRIDQEYVKAHPPVSPGELGARPDGKLFQEWLAQLQSGKYDKPDPAADPRQGLDDACARMREALEELERKASAQDLSGYKKEFARVAAEIERDRRVPWDIAHRADIEEKSERVAAGARDLGKRLGEALVQASTTQKEYIASLTSSAVSKSDRVNQEWRRRLKEIDESSDDFLTIRQKANRLKEDLERLDGQLSPGDLGVKTRSDREWNRQLMLALEKRREDALGEAFSTLSWSDGAFRRDETFERAWEKLRKEYDAFRSDLGGLAADFNVIEDRLDACYLPAEKPDQTAPSVDELQRKWAQSATYKAQDVGAALAPITTRLARLADLGGQTDPDALVKAATQAGGDSPEVVRAAWKRLGEVGRPSWPATVAQLREERQIEQKLAAMRALVDSSTRKAFLAEEVAAEAPSRWERCLTAVSRPDDIDEVIDAAGDFGVKPDKLTPESRFRVALRKLRQATAQSSDENTISHEIDVFLDAVKRLPGSLATKAPYVAFLTALADIRKSKGRYGDPSSAGPASSHLGDAWTSEVFDDGRVVEYTWETAPDTPHKLTFVRVDPVEGAEGTFYLCTTEVPVGLFSDVVDAAKRWADMGKLLSHWESGVDPRKGPRTWEWQPAGKPGIQRTDNWLYAKESYPESMVPETPTREHPIQYVTAPAALLLARVLGCRLPSGAEWKAACAKYQATDRDKAKPNLRDLTWQREQKHLLAEYLAQKQLIPPDWPDAGIFQPAGGDRKEGRHADVYEGYDDGVLWFRKAGSPDRKTPGDLVGNVAEFVFDDASAFEKAFKDDSSLSAEGVMNFLEGGGQAARLSVVGGSALSAPETSLTKPYPLGETRGDYSDVGFRLAFSPPYDPLSVQLRRLLDREGYLASPR